MKLAHHLEDWVLINLYQLVTSRIFSNNVRIWSSIQQKATFAQHLSFLVGKNINHMTNDQKIVALLHGYFTLASHMQQKRHVRLAAIAQVLDCNDIIIKRTFGRI